jgi:hypothetical protein
MTRDPWRATRDGFEHRIMRTDRQRSVCVTDLGGDDTAWLLCAWDNGSAVYFERERAETLEEAKRLGLDWMRYPASVDMRRVDPTIVLDVHYYAHRGGWRGRKVNVPRWGR